MIGQQRSKGSGRESSHAARGSVADVRDLHHAEAVSLQELRQCDLVVPTRVTLVDAGSTTDAVDEVRSREHVRGREHEQSAQLQVPARRIEERSGVRQMLDQLAGPYDVETTIKIHRLRISGNDRETARARALRERAVELDPYGLGGNGCNERVHPIGPVQAGARTDIEHGTTLEKVPHTFEAIRMRARLPVPGLQRMSRRHRRERTTTSRGLGAAVVAIPFVVIIAAGCSASRDATAAGPTPDTSTGPPSTTTSSGGVPAVVPIDGADTRIVALPHGLELPLIVHAHHDGTGSFVVRGLDGIALSSQVLATGLGPYDGTFAVGFVDPKGTETVALSVSTTGPWHLDIADARLSPRITGGLAGTGDAVFSYVGKATAASVIHTGQSGFVIRSYGVDGLVALVRAAGPYEGRISLPNGPVFVTVTADGRWSISPS